MASTSQEFISSPIYPSRLYKHFCIYTLKWTNIAFVAVDVPSIVHWLDLSTCSDNYHPLSRHHSKDGGNHHR